MSKLRIRTWYEHFQGNIYVAFSGGRDSTVLLDLVRSIYPEVPAIFYDTGLEYPEIRKFVREFENVTWLRPKLTFQQVINKYGYPIVSKEQSLMIYQFQHAQSDKFKQRLLGRGRFSISMKWRYLIDAPFNIGCRCCDIMKKDLAHRYEKEHNSYGIIGTRTEESRIRERQYLKSGCNAFDLKNPISRPISFWLGEDIRAYIEDKSLPVSKIYDIKGINHTGCMFCLFGLHFEPTGHTRFDLMKVTHPKLYDFCMNQLKLREVIDFYLNPSPELIIEGKLRYPRSGE